MFSNIDIEEIRLLLLNQNPTALTSVCTKDGTLKHFIYTMPLKYLNLPNGFTTKINGDSVEITNSNISLPLILQFRKL